MKMKYKISITVAIIGVLGPIIAGFTTSCQGGPTIENAPVINIYPPDAPNDGQNINDITTISTSEYRTNISSNEPENETSTSSDVPNTDVIEETDNDIIATSQSTADIVEENFYLTENEVNSVPFSKTPSYSYDGSVILEDISSDPRGNTYVDAYIFQGEYYSLNTGGGKYDKPYIEKYIDGKFDSFYAVINPYKTFDKYNKDVKAEIRIYADSNLIYTSNTITRLTENEIIDISVKGVKYLKIQLQPLTDMENYFNNYYTILSDAALIWNNN